MAADDKVVKIIGGTNPTLQADVEVVGGKAALDVNLVGGSSSGTQYTDGDVAVTHPVGTIPVFNNGGTITAVSAANPLPVSATISTAGLATSVKQSDGSQKTQIVDGGGNVIGATSNALDINIKSGSTSISSVIPGTGATNLGKAEDSAHSSGDVGVMSLAVRNDTGATLAGTDGDYIPLTVDSTGALRTDLNGTISTANSTTAVLAGGATFTGTGEDCLNYNEIRINVIASHASATDGLSIQQSSDNTNWDITDTYTIPATTGKTYSVPRQARYFRVVYTNGATLQTSFRLQTILNRLGSRVSSQRPGDAYTNETDLEQTQSFLMGYNSTNGSWDRIRTTGTGVLTTGSSDITATGSITTQNLVPAGTATAGSAVLSGALNGTSGLTVQVTGTYTGALSIQGTVDGSVWVTLAQAGGVFENMNTGTISATIPSAATSIYQVQTSGYNQVRITGLAAMTGTAVVTMRATSGTGLVSLSNALPAGANVIGAITNIIPGTGNTNLGTATGAAVSSSKVGVIAHFGRKDTLATLTGADGTYTEAKVDSIGAQWVHVSTIDAGSNIIGKVGIDQTTPGTTNNVTASGLVASGATQTVNPVPIGGIFKTTPLTLTDGQASDATVDSRQNLRVALVIRNSVTSPNYMADNADGVAVSATSDKAGGITRQTVYNGTSWDRMPGDTTGVKVQSHAVTNAGTFAVQAAGDVSAGASDSGNPVKIGGQARTTNPTAAADGQRMNFISDKLGKQVVVGSIRDLKSNQVTTITASTSETTIVTAVASTFLDLYGLIITNTSATAVNVAIKDATTGTTRLNIAVPAGDTRGFMLPESGAMKQTTVNNNWTATSSGSITSLIITALTVSNT